MVTTRFFVRRSIRTTLLWSVILGSYAAAKGFGLIKAYPTLSERLKLAASFSNNSSLEALTGPAHHLETVAGYINWNCLQVSILVGAVWALLLATNWFRGEEENGRMELLLTGSTTLRKTSREIITGLSLIMMLFFVLLGLFVAGIGANHSINIGLSAAFFYSLVVSGCILVFALIGALASQLLPTRSRAAAVSAGIFGAAYLIRAVGDITSVHWLLNITPLGWAEKAMPLVGSKPIWLLPIFLTCLVLGGIVLYLAGHRDLGASLFVDKDTRSPRYALLNTSLGLSVRVSKNTVMSWLLGLFLSGLFYSALTKTAISALKNVKSGTPRVHRLLGTTHLASANGYLGVIFLIEVLLMMAFAAYVVGSFRKDESVGYLDNILVRPVTRFKLFLERVSIGLIYIMLGGVFIGLGVWLGVFHLGLGVSFDSILKASLNIMAPAFLVYGAGILFFGFWPRLTTAAAYGLLLWAFLIDMLNSGLHLNHWLLDTSLINQLPLVPAVSPNWQVTITMAVIGLALIAIGGLGFHRRDLTNE